MQFDRAAFLAAERQRLQEASSLQEFADSPCLMTLGIYDPDDPESGPSHCTGVFDGTDPESLVAMANTLRYVQKSVEGNTTVTLRVGAFPLWK